jgi:hypothetical protein
MVRVVFLSLSLSVVAAQRLLTGPGSISEGDALSLPNLCVSDPAHRIMVLGRRGLVLCCGTRENPWLAL